MLSHARHWALDEPDAAPPSPRIEQLLDVLRRRLVQNPGRVWVATHRFELFGGLAPWILVLDGGRVVAQGNLRESLVLPRVEESLALAQRGPFRLWRRLETLLPEQLDGALAGPAPEEGRLAQVHALLMDRTRLELTP
jgi:energy-coupling factor transporter ATP-binding protein EcfA2